MPNSNVSKHTNPLLNISAWSRFVLAENGRNVLGIVVRSTHGEGSEPSRAVVRIRTSDPVEPNALITIPSIPKTGGCGRAEPINCGDHIEFDIFISYECVDTNSIGK